MTKAITEYKMVINYSIVDAKIKTEVCYPSNFLTLDDGAKVHLIGGIIDILNKTEVPGGTSNMNLEIAHTELVDECEMLFPLSSYLVLHIDNTTNVVTVDFTHDASLASIEQFHLLVLVDSIIKVMKATGICIVRKAEKDSVKRA